MPYSCLFLLAQVAANPGDATSASAAQIGLWLMSCAAVAGILLTGVQIYKAFSPSPPSVLTQGAATAAAPILVAAAPEYALRGDLDRLRGELKAEFSSELARLQAEVSASRSQHLSDLRQFEDRLIHMHDRIDDMLKQSEDRLNRAHDRIDDLLKRS